jgi:predicted AAA+ superfamily ATPase
MIRRNLENHIKKYAREYPVISIVGPRQSGKTTLAKYMFQNYNYVSLENMDIRHMAQDDPRGFLADYPPPVIIDEIQRVPQLFSYLQEISDSLKPPDQYILTGSQQFLLMETLTQSLSGRVITFMLFPFSYNELHSIHDDNDLEDIFSLKRKVQIKKPDREIEDIIFTGMYPRIHDRKLSPRKWIENYVITYIERDIRQLINVSNLRTFENFMKITASYSGQLVNYASISSALGLSLPTVKSWLSILETSGIIFILPPHYKNFSKRIVKTPKLYFVDTGILCFLLMIRRSRDLKLHPLWGNIFETFVISEFYKRIYHTAEIPPIYFWRDKTGNEIDLVVDFGDKLLPIEIKSSRTYSNSFKENMVQWFNLEGNTQRNGFIVYNGEQLVGMQSDVPTVPWWQL